MVGCALIVEVLYEPPFWLHALLWGPLILATTLLPLRPMKGLMIALQYHHKAAEGRSEGQGTSAVRRRRRRGLLLPGAFALVRLVVLLGLGIWQIERKAWKEALIATLDAALAAAPVALPPPAAWPALTPENRGIPARAVARSSRRATTRWSTPAARRCATT